MDIFSLYSIFEQHPIITTDSRNCPLGSIFFALKGANFNGNKYASKAIDTGCSYAVVDEAKYATAPNIILVEDSLKTLQLLANHHRNNLKIPILAITGTNGKTTTKELVTAVLAQEHYIISTEGNYNNHIGVPLTLLRMKKKHEIAIIEMGANHIDEIKNLCEIAEPNYGLITNIGQAHLEGFGSYENIVKAKGELYDYIRTRKEGKLFVDHDNPILRKMAEGITSIFYGLDNPDDQFVTGKIISANPYLTFEWKMAKNFHTVETRLIGDYNLPNALAAITIGKYFGIKGDLICKSIAKYEPSNSRSQLKKTKRNMLIVDSYNANPTSMLAALQNFDKMEVKHKILILGEMKELGPNSHLEHQKIIDYIEHHKFSKVILVGDNFGQVSNQFTNFDNVNELITYLQTNPIKDNYVLLKGSRSVELEKAIELL